MNNNNNMIKVSQGISGDTIYRINIFNNRIIERVFASLFLLLGVYGIMLSFSIGYLERTDVWTPFITMAPFAIILMILFGLNGRSRLTGFIIAVFAALIFTFIYIDDIARIYTEVYYYVGKWISWYIFNTNMTVPGILKMERVSDFNGMCIAFSVLWVICMSYTWSSRGHIYGAVIGLTFYMAIFFSGGYMPDILPLGLMIISVAVASLKSRAGNAKEASRNGVWLNNIRREIAFALVFFVAFAMYGRLFPVIGKALLPIQDAIYEGFHFGKVVVEPDPTQEYRPGGNSTASGGISGGQTGQGGSEFKPQNVTVMEVTFGEDIDHSTYLKAYVADTYDGSKWINTYDPNIMFPVDEKRYEAMCSDYHLIKEINYQKEYYDYESNQFIIDGELYNARSTNIRIKSIADDLTKNGYVCIPYAGFVADIDGEIQNGFYLKRAFGQSNINEYSYYDYPGGYSSINDDSFYQVFDSIDRLSEEYVKAYDNVSVLPFLSEIANDYYLEVPEFLSSISEKYKDYKWSNINEAVRFVQDELKDGFVYDTKPGVVPKGKDYIEYFLFESKRGYCMYYASAATMIFRSIGIPARYVEGYLVGPTKKNVTKDVKDSNAHAWTEIFIEGYGWIPVEVTNASFTGEGFVPTPTTTQSQPHETTTATKPTKPNETTKPGETTVKNTTASSGTVDGPNGNSKPNMLLKVVFIVLGCIAGIAILMFAIRGLFYVIYAGRLKTSKSLGFRKRLLKIYKSIYRMTRSEKAITAEGNMTELSEYWNIDIDMLDRLRDYLYTAEYSNKRITSEECEFAEKIETIIMTRKKAKARGIKKLYYMRMLSIRRKLYASK